MPLAAALLVPLALAALARGARDDQRPLDELELSGGERLACWVLREEEDGWLVRVGSRERTLAREDVRALRWSRATLREAFARLDASDGGAPARVELARFLAGRGLEGDARLLAWSALALDRDHAAAHELLGHVRRNGLWRVREGSSWLRFEDLLERRADFARGWELETTHWRIATNLDLTRACAAALDLERFALALPELLGPEAGLIDVVRRMRASLHADESSFPESLGSARSYFDPATNTILLNAAQGLERAGLVHEALHQLAFTMGEELRGGSALPGWANEGLAVYVESAARGGPGRLALAPAPDCVWAFAQHAAAEDPYRLSRVLSFASDDFHGSSRTELKYAQATTLVHHLLHGEQGALRSSFLAFVRGALRGKGSSTDLKRALALSERELEAGWKRHVAAGGAR